MKINPLVLLSLFFICNSLYAKDIDVEIKSQSCFVKGDSLMVSVKCIVNTHDFTSDESLTIIPVIKENRQEKELAPVLLNGKKRHRIYERNRVLNKRKGIEGEKYFFVRELSGEYPCEVIYNTSVASENWMRMPELFLKVNRLASSGEIVQETIGLKESGRSPEVKRVAVTNDVTLSTKVSEVSGLKASYISPESDATDIRNQKELNFNLEEARVVAEMNPQMLSLRELYMVALSYKNEPGKFYQIIETSVKIYPAHPVANLNAAAAAIEQGNWQAAGEFLRMAPHETLAYKNCKGVYELMTGNLYEGIRLLKAAKAEGSEEAGMNLAAFFENNKHH